jgi:hypothetical protein
LSGPEADTADDGHLVGLEDVTLRRSVARMRRGEHSSWSYVEHLCEIDGRPAGLVNDDGFDEAWNS